MLFLCRGDVEDVVPTLEQHWVNASCFAVIGVLAGVSLPVSVCRGSASPLSPTPSLLQSVFSYAI